MYISSNCDLIALSNHDVSPKYISELKRLGITDFDVDDLVALIGAWGPAGGYGPADLNQDGDVNVDDLLAMISAWGPCP